jgi:hypothetical protein
MSDVIDRRVVLGGETRTRGIVAGNRSRLEWAGMVLTGIWVVPIIASGTVSFGRAVGALVVLAVAFFVWTPFPGPLAGSSVAAWVAWESRHQLRRRRPGAVFVPRHQQVAASGTREAGPARTKSSPASAPVFDFPEAVGRVRVLALDLPSGAPLAVVWHLNPGRRHFCTVAFEVRGTSGGLERAHTWGRAHGDWASFCGALARDGSLIRTVQQISRVVPYDAADHAAWIAPRIPAGTDPHLVESYAALLDEASSTTEQHRTWLVLRLPITKAFDVAAWRLGSGDDGMLRLVAREVVAAMHRAAGYGMALRPLDERRLGAVIRALQDADHPIDDIAGLDFNRAWLTWDQRDRHKVVVEGINGQWHTRTAVVPGGAVEAGRLAPDFLDPLLSGVSPAVVRTISTVIDLVPAHVARGKATRAVTLDTGSSREAARRVSDGSEEQQLTASQQRLSDLRPGTRTHGANWSLSITLCARSDDELDAAARQIEGAAEEAHISGLRWLDGFHDGGLTASLPLARGMATRQ